jgi:hypothetical protein
MIFSISRWTFAETYTTYENTKKQHRKKTCKRNDRVSHDKEAEEEFEVVGNTLGESSLIGTAGTAGVGGIE